MQWHPRTPHGDSWRAFPLAQIRTQQRNDKNEASELGKYLTDSPPSQVGKTGVFPREYQSADSLARPDTTNQTEINSGQKHIEQGTSSILEDERVPNF